MTDFVTRLESELHAAAVRRERAVAVRRVATPRMRLALRALPTAAAVTVLLALALTGVTIMLASSPQPPTKLGVPPVLRGIWRAPPTELRLYAAGSQRCVNLGLGSIDPCYALGDSGSGVAHEWGKLYITADKLTLRAAQDPRPGLYRWRVQGGRLRLTEVRDPIASRVTALATTPLGATHRRRKSQAKLPSEWAQWPVTSERFGYSIRLPHSWTRDTGGSADRYSPDTSKSVLPAVSITAQDLPPGTSAARWGVIADSRFEVSCAATSRRRFTVDGAKITMMGYRDCGGVSSLSASFVHGRRGYRAVWRGAVARTKADGRVFEALLKTIVFSP
jgi:hypothetical protein